MKPPAPHAMTPPTRPDQAAQPGLTLPSLRASAALATAMLAIGVGIGAAIGPTPESSFAGTSRLPFLLPYLASSLQASTSPPAVAASSPSPAAPQATPTSTPAPSTGGQAQTSSSPAPVQSSSSSPSTSEGKKKASAPSKTTLPTVGHVWLITLSSGGGFSNALANPSSAPVTGEQLISQGTLLTNYSALAANELASASAQLSGKAESNLTVITEPPCATPTDASCPPSEPAGLTRADDFLGEVVPAITASTAYSQAGLILITFGAVSQGVSIPGATSATPVPGSPAPPSSSASTTTLTAPPATGVLALSPLVQSGTRIATSFDPLDPRKSLERIFGS